nr:N-acetyltransferase [uncultured Desulfobulbus sp.]
MKILNATFSHTQALLRVHQRAFGARSDRDKGLVISQLVRDLLEDPTATPRHSLIAVKQDIVIGHVLFTNVHIEGALNTITAQILAPLAVLPEYHAKGIGQKLIMAGLDALQRSGSQLVFVLGHPAHYPRCGFTPAGACGFEAPYPIPEEHAAAWMVQELSPGVIGTIKGKIRCADSLHQPEHWRE